MAIYPQIRVRLDSMASTYANTARVTMAMEQHGIPEEAIQAFYEYVMNAVDRMEAIRDYVHVAEGGDCDQGAGEPYH